MTNPLTARRAAAQADAADHGFTRPFGKLAADDLRLYADELNDRWLSVQAGWFWVVVKAQGRAALSRLEGPEALTARRGRTP